MARIPPPRAWLRPVALGLAGLVLPPVACSSVTRSAGPPEAQAPGIRFLVTPSEGPAPLTVAFEALSSSGPASFRWRFPDGSSATGNRASHTFYRPGRYRVAVEASLPDGRRASGEAAVWAKDAGPERARIVVLPEDGRLVRLDARASVVYEPGARYSWRFADGATAEGPQIERRLEPGLHRVTLTVSGGSRLERTLTLRTGPVELNTGFEARLLALTNAARAGGWDCDAKALRGATRLPPLSRAPLLDRAARAQSVGMALGGYFDHTNPLDGSGAAERASASGYTWLAVGENIAAGQPGPEEVVDSWLRSPGHCRNIMSADFSEIGLAYARTPGGRPQWTQVFGRPRG